MEKSIMIHHAISKKGLWFKTRAERSFKPEACKSGPRIRNFASTRISGQRALLGWLVFIACVLGVPGVATTAWAEDALMADYLIGPGDVLDISVWKNSDLTKVVTVLPDGKISFPLIGDMTAAGKTAAQLNTELREKLLRFVPDVDLSVIIAQVNSMNIYVIGRVRNPGRFVLNAPITVMQALAIAGGPDTFAKQGSIRVFRGAGAKRKIFEFDYDDVAKGRDIAQDITLQRGDLIFVP